MREVRGLRGDDAIAEALTADLSSSATPASKAVGSLSFLMCKTRIVTSVCGRCAWQIGGLVIIRVFWFFGARLAFRLVSEFS